MKAKSLSLTVAVFMAGIALAQAPPPPNTAEDASSAAKEAPESTQSNAPSPATMSPSAADAKASSTQSTSRSCAKQASDKKLTGDDKTNFVKSCKAGKSTSD
jgi:psiF repeat